MIHEVLQPFGQVRQEPLAGTVRSVGQAIRRPPATCVILGTVGHRDRRYTAPASSTAGSSYASPSMMLQDEQIAPRKALVSWSWSGTSWAGFPQIPQHPFC